MERRYQIFISSTFADLKEEREKVMRAILELKCFPAGMELFKAGSKPKFNQISRVIDECDFYILIIGARYGSMDKDGVSWTEKEYNYACDLGVPVLAFVHGNIRKIPLEKADLDNKLRRKLEAFKKRIEDTSIVSYWENADELKSNVLSCLHDVLEQEKKDKKRMGWVRADEVVSNDSQKEIERLQNEIAKLLSEIKRLEDDLKKKNALDSLYQNSQQKITNLNEQIRTLKIELKKLKEITSLPETKEFIIPDTDVSFKMVHVMGGTFKMGAYENEDKFTNNDEKPTHEVTLSDYWIGETLVTNALWWAVMDNKCIQYNTWSQHPVTNVSWTDCKEFIRKLNKLTGKKFRLPTEAQWEFAARGGNRGKDKNHQFAGSNNVHNVAWFFQNSALQTHPVKRKDSNELGIYDMSGNVCEWCQDYYDSNYYRKSPINDPTGPKTGSDRVYRGGSWSSGTVGCRVTHRGFCNRMDKRIFLGLRLAL